ncbi:polycystin-2-like protein 2 [Onthophagus taurus]|uniref:polycystin-2-like protein 2 n=1 Tax=Onthophagus taurus TaxID=166361 RepID=UPI0039BE9B78
MEYSSSSEHSDKDREKDKEVFKKDRKYDFDKFQKTKWVTGEMGPYFKRDLFLLVHARATILYVAFVVCLTVAALGMVDDKMFFMSQSLRDHLKEQAGHESPTLEETSTVKFEDITTIEKMWDFIRNHLIKYLHAQQFPGTLRPLEPEDDNITDNDTEDAIIDEVEEIELSTLESGSSDEPPKRKRQADDTATSGNSTGNENDTLDEDYVDEEFLFDRGLGHENILVGPAVIRAVMVTDYECTKPFASVFIRCYPPYSSAYRKEDTSESYTFHHPEQTLAEPFTGRVSVYDGGGYQEKLGTTYEESRNITRRLKNQRYILKGTRAVFIDAAYYNPSINLFCSVKFLFELPAGGGVVPSAYFYTLKLTRVSMRDYINAGFQIVFLIFILFFILEAFRSMCFVKLEYFRSFWNIINIAIFIACIKYFYYFFTQMVAMHEVIQAMKKDRSEYISFQTITRYEISMRNYLAVVIFLVYFKIFKYLSFNFTMTILNKTIEKCLEDVFAFALMFFVMFMAFALFGSLCFGNQIVHFSTIPLAMFTLLRTMLGDFDYNEFEDADRYVAQLYYLLYIFSVFLILLNLFLAIINDTYSDAKTELTTSAPERRVADYWKTGLYNIMVGIGCKRIAPKALVAGGRVNPSAKEVRAALKRIGYSELDIDLFLGRYNIDPDSQVRVKDVSKLLAHLKANVPNRYLPKIHPSKDVNPPAIVALDDFSEQQSRLVLIENMMLKLGDKLDALLERLGTIKDPDKATSSESTM